jgi:galactosamine-6-phosphate isomerase
MKIIIADNYKKLSEQAADDVIQLMRSFKHPLLCTASGDSPAGIYKNIVDRVNKKELDISDWFFVGLDEWVGLNGNDEGSCRFYLNNQLFDPLQVAADKISFFDGKAKDLDKECKDADNFILHYGRIDIAVLGLGMNGHIGMNEPGTSSSLRSHVVALDPVTQKTGQKYFKKQQELKEGITLGLATLMESKHIILLVSGSHKAEIVKQTLEGEISEQLPCSLLRKHPGLKIYLDADAAKLINHKYG